MNKNTTFTEDLFYKLQDILGRASEKDRSDLAEMLEEYARRYPASYHDIRQGKVAKALALAWEALIEGTDARPEDTLA